MSEGQEGSAPPKKKRTRLSCSCVRCRKRKIRCDEQQPRCTNCAEADVECIVERPPKSTFIEPVRRKTGKAVKINEPQLVASTSQSMPLGGTDMILSGFINHNSGANEQSPESTVSNATIAGYQGNGVMLSDAETLLTMHRVSMAAATSTFSAPVPQQQPHASWSAFGPSPAPTNDTPTSDLAHPRVNDDGMLHHSHEDEPHKFCGSSSSQVFIKWLDSESTGAKLAHHFPWGAASCEEYRCDSLWRPDAPLPEPAKVQFYIQRFFETWYPLFPIVDRDAVQKIADQPNKGDDVATTILHLVISLGADASTPSAEFSAEGQVYLDQAYKALPLLLAKPYRSSVQAILLLCLGLRVRNADGACWTFAGLATRLAQSLGLHHSRPSSQASLNARIWFSCYALDKILSFEGGRPSAIVDATCTASLASIGDEVLLRLPGRKPLNVFAGLVGIAHELSLISTTLFSRGAKQMQTIEALQLIGEADARLLRWVDSLPPELRPTQESSGSEVDIQRFAALLHVTYYTALITIHRLGLFDELTAVFPNLDHPSLAPYVNRLRASAGTCTSAARGILSSLEALSINDGANRTWTCHCIITAIFVIAIRVYKDSSTWQAKADLTLLQNACEFTATRYRELGFHPKFISLLPGLYKKVEDKVQRPNQPSRPGTRAGSPALTYAASYSNSHGRDDQQQQSSSSSAGQQPRADSHDLDLTALGDLWFHLMGDGSDTLFGGSAWNDAFAADLEPADPPTGGNQNDSDRPFPFV